MTSKDLIEILQKLDPEGDREISFSYSCTETPDNPKLKFGINRTGIAFLRNITVYDNDCITVDIQDTAP